MGKYLLKLDYGTVAVILYLDRGFLQISQGGGVHTLSCTYMFHPTVVMWLEQPEHSMLGSTGYALGDHLAGG